MSEGLRLGDRIRRNRHLLAVKQDLSLGLSANPINGVWQYTLPSRAKIDCTSSEANGGCVDAEKKTRNYRSGQIPYDLTAS